MECAMNSVDSANVFRPSSASCFHSWRTWALKRLEDKGGIASLWDEDGASVVTKVARVEMGE